VLLVVLLEADYYGSIDEIQVVGVGQDVFTEDADASSPL